MSRPALYDHHTGKRIHSAVPPPPRPANARAPEREPGSRAVRPREAATLIIYRRVGRSAEVLMGERHRKHRFMPSMHVFPGGRVDATDSRVRVGEPLSDDVACQLERRLTPARARATAVAAVRETFEETGLIVGTADPEPGATVPKGWEDFFATGMAPALGHLQYIARAVTPPIRPVRFSARFFMVDAEYVRGDLTGNGELLDLHWFPIDTARALDLPGITRVVLTHIEELFRDPPARSPDRRIPYFKHMGSYHMWVDE